jgi:hypothetical protein
MRFTLIISLMLAAPALGADKPIRGAARPPIVRVECRWRD